MGAVLVGLMVELDLLQNWTFFRGALYAGEHIVVKFAAL